MNTTTITEADVIAYLVELNNRLNQELASDGPFEMEPYVYATSNCVQISAYVEGERAPFLNVSGHGATLDQALAKFRTDLDDKRPSPARLRASAKKLLDEAAKMEGAQS